MRNWLEVTKTLPLYDRFRYSPAYELLAQARGTPYAIALANDRDFFSRLFAKYKIRRVFDVGSNVGDKARVFAEYAHWLVCVEPDPDLAAILRRRFKKNSSVYIETVAVGGETGESSLFRKAYSGFNTLSPKWSDATTHLGVGDVDTISVRVLTLNDLIAKHGSPDFIKIDVEGYELPAFRGLTAAIPVVSFEANLPAFMEETREIVDSLALRHPETCFNMRVGDEASFRLRGAIGGIEMLAKLEGLGKAACDIFAFRNSL